MNLHLRTSLIEARIKALGGRETVAQRAKVDRTTLWRWLRGGKMPERPQQLADLAAALDLDPNAIFDLTPEMFPTVCQRLGAVIRSGRWVDFLPAAACMESLFLPASSWPPPDIAAWYHRPWYATTFIHQPEKDGTNLYLSFLIDAPDGKPPAQYWHFAFRNRRGVETFWLPYGYVCRFAERVEIYNYGMGHANVVIRGTAEERFIVQTWLGDSPCDFSIASLHPFNLKVVSETFQNLPLVRFEYR